MSPVVSEAYLDVTAVVEVGSYNSMPEKGAEFTATACTLLQKGQGRQEVDNLVVERDFASIAVTKGHQ